MESSTKKRTILAVDDNQTNLAVLKVHVRQMKHDILIAESGKDCLEKAAQYHPDLILLDIMMPVMDGYETCRRLKEDTRTANIPIIFLSAKDQATDKISGLEMGAIDYITKPFDPGELRARVAIVFQMISLQEKLLAQANTDELTGVANRRSFRELLDREILQSKNFGRPLSLVMIDIDHFKKINDTYGHLGGDAILKQLAKLLGENVQNMDLIARYGGEEFVIIMPDTPADKARLGAEKIRQLVEKYRWKLSTENVQITISMGIDYIDAGKTLTAEDLIRNADSALYLAKQRGRNCVLQWDQTVDAKVVSDMTDSDFQKLQDQVQIIAQTSRGQLVQQLYDLVREWESQQEELIGYTEDVIQYTAAIASTLSLKPPFIDQMITAVKLRDIGRVVLPPIPDEHSETNRQKFLQLLHKHPLVSVQVLEPIGVFHKELLMIRHHHEHFDGTGFPDGLRGNAIPFGARILAIAAFFKELTTTGYDRSAYSLNEAVEEIRRSSGTRFDPEIVDAFLQTVRQHAEEWPLSSAVLTG